MDNNNRKIDKEEALDKLMGKMVNEMNEFTKSVAKMSGQQIIEKMIPYELVYKEDILMCFEDDELLLSCEEIKFLLDLNQPLDWLYQEWLDFDDSHMGMLRDFITCALDRRM